MFTQTSSPGEAWGCCLELLGGEVLPHLGKKPRFQQTTLQFIYKGLPRAWESIIEQVSFLCRLNPFASNSKNL